MQCLSILRNLLNLSFRAFLVINQKTSTPNQTIVNDPVRIARRRAKAKRAYYIHLTSYLTVGGFLFILNILTDPYYWWFFWPLLGWGIGLVSHYLAVFGVPGMGPLNEEWEDRQTEKELQKMGLHRLEEPRDRLELPQIDKEPVARPSSKSNWGDDDLV